MRTLRATTKQAQRFINAYNISDATSLDELYRKPSYNKINAYNWCLEQFAKENGKGFRITGAGTFTFSVAWMTDAGLRVETAQNSYLITL